MKNDLVRFALIIGALLLVYYLVNGQKSAMPEPASPASNGMVPVEQFEMPESEAASCGGMGQVEEIGSPEDMTGASFDHLNWDGVGDNVMAGALSKQWQDLTGEDLLPHNDIAQFAEVYPNGVGQVQGKNFRNAGHHVGINTVGQANKNANYQLRSDPINPQNAVSPWLQSSIGPDLTRRPFELGCEA